MWWWWTTHTATGTRVLELPFACPDCGFQAGALVHSHGRTTSNALFGIGASKAREHAEMNVSHAAVIEGTRALRETTCPKCGVVPPFVVGIAEAFTHSVERKKRIALPVARGVAAFAALALAYPAIADLRHSVSFLVMAVGVVTAVFGVTYVLAGWPPQRPLQPSAVVCFWGTRADGVADWVPAAPNPLTALPVPSIRKLVMAGVLILLGGTVGLVAYELWQYTFRDVLVFDTGALEGARLVVDGKPVDRDAHKCRGCTDGSVDVLTFRAGEDHELEIVKGDGTRHGPFTLSGRDKHGWLVAPEAEANGACFGEFEVIYGRAGAEPTSRPLEVPSGLLTLTRRYDDVFVSSPPAMTVRLGVTVTRWELRALPCEADDDDPPTSP